MLDNHTCVVCLSCSRLFTAGWFPKGNMFVDGVWGFYFQGRQGSNIFGSRRNMNIDGCMGNFVKGPLRRFRQGALKRFGPRPMGPRFLFFAF